MFTDLTNTCFEENGNTLEGNGQDSPRNKDACHTAEDQVENINGSMLASSSFVQLLPSSDPNSCIEMGNDNIQVNGDPVNLYHLETFLTGASTVQSNNLGIANQELSIASSSPSNVSNSDDMAWQENIDPWIQNPSSYDNSLATSSLSPTSETSISTPNPYAETLPDDSAENIGAGIPLGFGENESNSNLDDINVDDLLQLIDDTPTNGYQKDAVPIYTNTSRGKTSRKYDLAY